MGPNLYLNMSSDLPTHKESRIPFDWLKSSCPDGLPWTLRAGDTYVLWLVLDVMRLRSLLKANRVAFTVFVISARTGISRKQSRSTVFQLHIEIGSTSQLLHIHTPHTQTLRRGRCVSGPIPLFQLFFPASWPIVWKVLAYHVVRLEQ